MNNQTSKKQKSIFKKISNCLFYVLITILVIVICVSLYCKKTNKLVFHYSILYVLTDSMEPDIPARSYILVKRVNPDDVEKDDIITFRSTDPAIYGQLNTHKVYEVVGDHESFWTIGTHINIRDNYPVPRDNVEAVLVKKLPVITFIGNWLATKAGLALTLIIITGSISIYSYYLIKNEKKKAEEEQMEALIKAEVERLEREGLNKN